VTNATPKIADYPFTTLEPNLGVANLDDEHTLVLADIPGLIEGAHEGVGLGDAFLRHIQRTRVLIHILDGLSEDPVGEFGQINAELSLFDARLTSKPQVVAFNKMDLPDVQAHWPEVKAKIEAAGFEIIPISAVTHQNVEQVLWKVQSLLENLPVPEVEETIPVYKPAEDPRDFTIIREADGWRVKGAAIERAAEMTYWEHESSLRHFHRLMEKLGVDEALREAGVSEGDSVYIGEYDWSGRNSAAGEGRSNAHRHIWRYFRPSTCGSSDPG